MASSLFKANKIKLLKGQDGTRTIDLGYEVTTNTVKNVFNYNFFV